MEPITRPMSLCNIAVESIRNAIIEGTYELGEHLSEAKLVKSLGISKTPVREALSILKLEGIVSVVPQKGTFVFTLSANKVAQLGHYRNALESTALEMSMKQNPDKLIIKLLAVCADMEEVRDRGENKKYLQLDMDFHETILDNCGNSYLIDGYKMISSKIAALRTHLSSHPINTEKSFTEHIEISQSLQKGELKAAKKILFKHTTRGERRYNEAIKDISKVS